uniref:Peptidase inhibitor 16 n=1 Tax=Pelusios castaneus TaxID=367368 RepID=A0A8C8S0R0_9SAUR
KHGSLSTMLGSGLPLLLLLTAVELTWSIKDDDKRLIVELHNHYRSQVSPSASDMLKMSWAPDLEAFAKSYAEKCIWGHNKERGRRGENLFAITDEMDVEVAMEQWYHEHAHYNLTTSKCAVGQMCGHYTQVVWANSERVGCGVQFCKTLHGVEEQDLYLLVCNYDPPGNVRGRKPYKEGPPCSKCPEGYACRNSLCGKKLGGRIHHHFTSNPWGYTTTKPAPATTLLQTTPTPTTSATNPTPTITARALPTTAPGSTSSLEPASDLDLKTSPETEVDSEETNAPLVTTEAVLLLDLESTLSPKTSPEIEGDLKELNAASVSAEPDLFSESLPSTHPITPETDLSLEDTKQPSPALKPAPSNANVTTILRSLPSSKATGGHSLALQSSLSGKAAVE